MIIYGGILLLLGNVIWYSRKENTEANIPKGMKAFYRCAIWTGKKMKAFRMLDIRAVALAILIILIGDAMALAMSAAEYAGAKRPIEVLTKGGYGEKREEALQVQEEDGETYRITIPVPGKAYTAEEIAKMFQNAMEKMDSYILGQNKSLDYIDQQMNLITEIPQTPIQVNWTTSRPDILDWQGKIGEATPAGGTVVSLEGELVYQDKVEIYSRKITVYPLWRPEKELHQQDVIAAVEKGNEDEQEENYVLPTEVNGKKLRWYQQESSNSLLIAGITVMMAVILVLGREQERKQAKEVRKMQMMRDYPEILSKFILLLNAGMSMRKAFAKIGLDYKRQQETLTGYLYGHVAKNQENTRGRRYAYEEFLNTYYEMEKGISEREAYERLGFRCDTPQYKTFSMLLVQNLKKGNKNLMEMLERESASAFEERKRLAKILGEKAGTKLLLPMGSMLVIVFVILLVPAFLSF